MTDEPIDLTGVVVLRRGLIAAGYTDRQIRTRVKAGELHRVRHGSYCDATLWSSLDVADQHRVLARAVLRRAHLSTVLTHVSSAVEQGAPVWGHDLTKVHTTRTDGRAGRKESDRVQHAGTMPVPRQQVNGVPVSLATRCAVEMTTVSTVDRRSSPSTAFSTGGSRPSRASRSSPIARGGGPTAFVRPSCCA